ncbi:MAG: hypothetical protein J6V01_01365, partial [Clostridia bacterium]|nr:hypothetical protein [Clostridia bacterium]
VSPRLLSKGRRKNGSTIYALKRCVVDLTSEILKNRLFSCNFSVKTGAKITRQSARAICAVLP